MRVMGIFQARPDQGIPSTTTVHAHDLHACLSCMKGHVSWLSTQYSVLMDDELNSESLSDWRALVD
jgi:hypothetical protein